MATTLVIRLSSLGDVAMLIPVLYSIATKNPGDKFLLITKPLFTSIFVNKPTNLEVIPVYTEAQHKGICLWKLVRELNRKRIDNVADLHDVLRSKQIDLYFRLKGKKVAVINKGRKEKKALTCRNNKRFQPLKSSIGRYQEVFQQLGYNTSLDFRSLFTSVNRDFTPIEPFVETKEGSWIGIAPFAKHLGKTYPLEQMEEVIRLLTQKSDVRIFLFGGKGDKKQLGAWANKYEQVQSVAGCFSFSEELLLMSYMDVLLSMDSGNMHLASLVGVPVVSIWGATHPYAGFYGYNQDSANAIQSEMECRPCSIFGNKPCYRGDYACMKKITPEMVVQRIIESLL